MSTLLSLVFMPAAFTVLDDVGRLSWRLFRRLVGEADEHVPERAKPASASIKRPVIDIPLAAE